MNKHTLLILALAVGASLVGSNTFASEAKSLSE
jgi:hypothetical protein